MNTSSDLRDSWRWAIIGLFALVIAIFGGSSRYDAVQLAALRPLAALFLIPGLYLLTLDKLRSAGALVWLLGLWTVWTAFQLVPLPPAAWQWLPGRGAIAELDALAGAETVWRPISMVPARGWNALAALIVPVTALLLALSLRADRRLLLIVIAMLALLDAALGLLQVAMGPNSALYFYAKTNAGSPVGIFANENHSAMFSALGMIILGYLAGSSSMMRVPGWLKLFYALAFLLALLSIFAGGSRLGFALAFFAIAVAAYLAVPEVARPRRSRQEPGRAAQFLQRPQLLVALFGAVLAGLFAAFYAFERLPGLEDLFSENVFEELRWQIWSILEAMIGVYGLLGAGFGAFEEVYHIYEPTDLMVGAYLNQAHNDWAQLVIEGGAPALLLVLGLVVHVVKQLRPLVSGKDASPRDLILWLSVIAVICAASLVDYPLRTPVFQMVVVFLLVGLSLDARQRSLSEADRGRRPESQSTGNRSFSRA